MGLTFLPITEHGNLLGLDLDQHTALLPVSGIRKMTGNLSLDDHDINDIKTTRASEHKGRSDLRLREDGILLGENDTAELAVTTVEIGEDDVDALALVSIDPDFIVAMKSATQVGVEGDEGVSLISEEEIGIHTRDMVWTTPDADGVNFQLDDEGAHWLDQAGELDPFVFDILNSEGVPGFVFDHNTSSTTIFGGTITFDVVTQSALFPDGVIKLIGRTKLGDGGVSDYVDIGTDGFITLVGDSRVTNKLSVLATGAGAGVSTPTLTVRAVGASGDVEIDVLRFSKVVQNDARINFCSSDMFDDSVNGNFVLKWIPGAAWTGGNFVWVLEYIVKGSDEDITTGTPTTISVDVTPVNATDKIETVFGDSINLDAGQVLSGHFYRDVASDNGDDVGDVERFQFEYTANKLGKSIAA